MPTQLVLQVPKSAWPDIEIFLRLPIGEVSSLIRCLENTPPKADIEDLAEICAGETGISESQVEAVIRFLINLNRLHRGADGSPERLFSAFENAVARSGNTAWEESLHNAWNERKNLLMAVLSPDSGLAIMAKVRELLYESQCVFTDSMVLTDVRHVYNDSGDRILGGIVLHTLSLNYLEADETRQIHVTMTSDEVRKLIGQLTRDQLKAKVATELLAQQNLPELTPKRNIQP